MIAYPVSFVSLPIGNRDDITRRALDVLGSVDSIVCEDTRHTGMLLVHYGISRPLLSMHEHNEAARASEIAERALSGERFAVVSDAGMPGVSDPGYRLIQELKRCGVAFTVLPGPSAAMTALVGSGLPSDAFFFGGFLPVKSGRKATVLQKAVAATHTSIFYESPYRIVKTLEALTACDPETPVCVARELTKVFETYLRGSAAAVLAELKARPPKGEIVLVVGGVNAPRLDAPGGEKGQQQEKNGK